MPRTPRGRGNRWTKTQLGKAGSHANFINRVPETFARITSRYNVMHSALEELTLESVQVGSAITSAPGQPVDQFVLLPSYHIERLGVRVGRIVSYMPYAWGIENGVGPYGPIQLRSNVGGFHSIAITVSAIDRLARAARDVALAGA